MCYGSATSLPAKSEPPRPPTPAAAPRAKHAPPHQPQRHSPSQPPTTASASRPRPPPSAYSNLHPAPTRLLNPLNHLSKPAASAASAPPAPVLHPPRRAPSPFSDSSDSLLDAPDTHSAYSVTVLPLQGPRVARTTSRSNRRSTGPREITIMHPYLSPDDGQATDTDADTSRSATPNIRLPLQMMEPALFRPSPDLRRGTATSTSRSWLENADRDSRSSMAESGLQLDDLRASTQRTSTLQPIGDEESRPASRGSRESEWNSSHPCYPHRNPYVPADSPLYESTRVIRIARDFMEHGDLAPAYSNVFPDILEPHVSEDQFRAVVARVNGDLKEAFDPWNKWNWLDAIVGLLTLWLVEEVAGTHCKRVLKRVEAYLEEWNRELGERGQKAVFVPLRRSGYMNLDIQIPDPIPAASEEDGESNTKFNIDNSDAGSIVTPLASPRHHVRLGSGELSLGSMGGNSLGPYLSR